MKETLTTLKFAERAKKIKNKAVVNEENNEKVYQKKYLQAMAELTKLRESLKSGQVVSSIPDTSFLMKDNFDALNQTISRVQTEVATFTGEIKELTNENSELKQTFDKAQKEASSFRSSSQFRLNLYSSKEQKQIEQFFSKYLSSGCQDQLLVSELGPMKMLIDKLTQENGDLLKQIERNPVAIQHLAKVTELQGKLDSFTKQLDPQGNLQPSSVIFKLNSLESLQDSINSNLLKILERIQEEQMNATVSTGCDDQDAHMDDGQIESSDHSKKLIASLSKHTKVEMEDVKKRY